MYSTGLCQYIYIRTNFTLIYIYIYITYFYLLCNICALYKPLFELTRSEIDLLKYIKIYLIYIMINKYIYIYIYIYIKSNSKLIVYIFKY